MLVQKKVVRKILGLEKISPLKNFWFQKKVGSEKILQPKKIFGPKNFVAQKVLDEKKFGSKKIFGQKNFGS